MSEVCIVWQNYGGIVIYDSNYSGADLSDKPFGFKFLQFSVSHPCEVLLQDLRTLKYETVHEHSSWCSSPTVKS